MSGRRLLINVAGSAPGGRCRLHHPGLGHRRPTRPATSARAPTPRATRSTYGADADHHADLEHHGRRRHQRGGSRRQHRHHRHGRRRRRTATPSPSRSTASPTPARWRAGTPSRSTSPARTWRPMRTSPSRREHHLDRRGGQRGTGTDTESYTVDVTAPAPTITLTSTSRPTTSSTRRKPAAPLRSPARSAATRRTATPSP